MYKLKWFESGIWCDKREGEETKAVQVRDRKELARKKKMKRSGSWKRVTKRNKSMWVAKDERGTYYTTMEKGKESNKKKEKE